MKLKQLQKEDRKNLITFKWDLNPHPLQNYAIVMVYQLRGQSNWELVIL